MSELPDRPSLDSLRKQAKSLLRDFRARESTALQRVETHHPNLDRFSSLRDAKLVVAREYGIRSWPELVHSIETALDVARSLDEQATLLADLACLHYSGKEDVRHRERAARLLQERPDLVTANVYAAAAASDVVEIERWLQREPDCVNRPGGPRDWPPLMYVTYSRVPENSPERDGVATTRFLLDAGADPCFYIDGTTAIGGWRWYPLTGAIGEGEAGLVQQPPHPRARELADLLLDAGADPNDSQGLYNSMFTPGNEWLELLLSRGLTSTHRTDPDGDSPITTLNYQLSPAIQRGFTERVELLLNHGADAANRDEWYGGGTHVEEALKVGEGGILDFLVQHGAPEPELTPDDRYRIAVMQGDEAEARRCLETDPDLSDQTDLLVTAAHHGRLEAVRLLIDLGADPIPAGRQRPRSDARGGVGRTGERRPSAARSKRTVRHPDGSPRRNARRLRKSRRAPRPPGHDSRTLERRIRPRPFRETRSTPKHSRVGTVTSHRRAARWSDTASFASIE